ncbi:MAG TPA: inorganic diphosphatase [Vicinamibacterales bacterium]|nr:inorganic diphosphatase [Vicinamibacterales bacterium]
MQPLHTLDAFAEDDVFHVVVESPRGSTVKLKWDPRLGAMSVSRPLNLGLSFPYDWGFVPSTEGPDGDPIDALVYWDVSSYPGVVIPCGAIGLVKVDQRGDGSDTRVRNDRIIALPAQVRREHIGAPGDLPARIREELNQFFLAATALEGKDARILGWAGPAEALTLIRSSAT